MSTFSCFTVQEAKLGWTQRARGLCFPLMNQPPSLNTISISPPLCPPNQGRICIIPLKALIERRTNGLPGNLKKPHYCLRACFESMSIKTTIALPWPNTKTVLGGLGRGETRFCSPGDSCAPLMTTIAASSWLIAAHSSASFPALNPYYPAAG